jgi:hypothetical protein
MSQVRTNFALINQLTENGNWRCCAWLSVFGTRLGSDFRGLLAGGHRRVGWLHPVFFKYQKSAGNLTFG